MSLWLPGYTVVDLGPDGGPFDTTQNPKLCWHTTEGGSLEGAESAFAPYPPHLGVDPKKGLAHQYVSLDRHAYALKGTDTEDSWVIQVEVVGYAAQSHTWSLDILSWLAAHVVGPVTQLVPVPPVIAPEGFHGADEGIVLASPDSLVRFPSVASWDSFSGHVGHQHAPSPDAHWDPGRLDVAAILAYTGTDKGDWLDMASMEDVKAAVRAVLNEGTAKGQTAWAGTCKAQLGTEQTNYNLLNSVKATVEGMAESMGTRIAPVSDEPPPSSG